MRRKYRAGGCARAAGLAVHVEPVRGAGTRGSGEGWARSPAGEGGGRAGRDGGVRTMLPAGGGGAHRGDMAAEGRSALTGMWGSHTAHPSGSSWRRGSGLGGGVAVANTAPWTVF